MSYTGKITIFYCFLPKNLHVKKKWSNFAAAYQSMSL